MVSFRVGGENAKVLREEFSTSIAASQLQDLPSCKGYVRTLMGSRPTASHLVNTFPPAEETGEDAPGGRVARARLERLAGRRAKVEERTVRSSRQWSQRKKLREDTGHETIVLRAGARTGGPVDVASDFIRPR